MEITPNTPKTPKELRNEFKARAIKAANQLPKGWTTSFVAKFPEYNTEEWKTTIHNVARGLSYDQEITEKMEALVELLTPVK